jgi:tetratricopeptide (TPR) repeat protein
MIDDDNETNHDDLPVDMKGNEADTVNDCNGTQVDADAAVDDGCISNDDVECDNVSNETIKTADENLVDIVLSLAAAEVEAESVPSLNEILSCVSCCGLFSKAHTFECGHSLCGSCNEKSPRCPLPGPTCRDLTGFVFVVSDSGARTRLPRQQPAAQNILLTKLTSEIVFAGEDSAAVLRARANVLLVEGRTAEALALYDEGLAANPFSHTLHSNRCHALIELGRPADAVAAAAICAALHPNWAKGAFRLGTALEAAGASRDALAAFSRALLLLRAHADHTAGRGATMADCRAAEDRVRALATALAAAEGGPTAAAAALRRPAPPHPAAAAAAAAAGELLARRAAAAERLAGEDGEAECRLCYGILLDPTTTPCGHTFCRTCLVSSCRLCPRICH